MLRCLKPAFLTYRQVRNFSGRSPLYRKTSTLMLKDIKIQEPVIKLEKKRMPSGSVVLDSVREYTIKHPNCVLLVQVGDFYELYESHATRYASQLDLKLTKKQAASNVIVDFAGFPIRALERYLDILVNRLQCRVAICDQSETLFREDKTQLGIERRITRIITPGTVIEESFLDSERYNYLLSIYTSDQNKIGLAWVDISVGEFMMQETTLESLKDDLARIRPREIVLPKSMEPMIQSVQLGLSDSDIHDPIIRLLASDSTVALSYQDNSQFNAVSAYKTFQGIFPNFSLLSVGFNDLELSAAMALMNYVNETHIIKKIKWQMPNKFSVYDTVRIDSAAMSSLELVRTLQGAKKDSLLDSLDCTLTSAGSRLLSDWISSPLTNIKDIETRLNIVQVFASNKFLLEDIKELLKQSTDAQRALQRLALKRGQHSDVFEIWFTLDVIKNVIGKLREVKSKSLQQLVSTLDPHLEISNYIREAFEYEKIQSKEIKDYGYVKHTFHPKLVRLHKDMELLVSEKDKLYAQLREACGRSISMISEGNFKHIVEVTKRSSSHLLALYPNAQIVSSTKTKNRFQLEAWSSISLHMSAVHSEIVEIETEVFEKVVDRLLEYSTTILQSCRKLAQIDVFSSFASISLARNYIRPKITQEQNTVIVGGRHPVVEHNLAKRGKAFTSNDCILDEKQRIWLLTGPNMGGKSTFLRQYVIIVLMAHMGCFVPADSASIGITDRIFSRVGAADNLAQNQSTFMVEMSEVASILKLATKKSTVIMDEVGRGTSATEGFSLAFGILDHLHNTIQCRTLFATHYQELADSTKDYENIARYQTSIQENSSESFRFVHKVTPGVCRQSHALKVAQIAGIPVLKLYGY